MGWKALPTQATRVSLVANVKFWHRWVSVVYMHFLNLSFLAACLTLSPFFLFKLTAPDTFLALYYFLAIFFSSDSFVDVSEKEFYSVYIYVHLNCIELSRFSLKHARERNYHRMACHRSDAIIRQVNL